jgi:hypothetical protein
MRKIWSPLWILVLSTACGGGGGGPTGGSSLPSRTVISTGSVQLVDPVTAIGQERLCDAMGFVPFTTPALGTLDATVDWTVASNDIDVYLERGECTCAMALADACQDVASSESTTAKPEKLTVTNLSAGSYTLVIGNAGPGRESSSYEVGLTR